MGWWDDRRQRKALQGGTDEALAAIQRFAARERLSRADEAGLFQALTHPSWLVQSAAARALGARSLPELIERLARAAPRTGWSSREDVGAQEVIEGLSAVAADWRTSAAIVAKLPVLISASAQSVPLALAREIIRGMSARDARALLDGPSALPPDLEAAAVSRVPIDVAIAHVERSVAPHVQAMRAAIALTEAEDIPRALQIIAAFQDRAGFERAVLEGLAALWDTLGPRFPAAEMDRYYRLFRTVRAADVRAAGDQSRFALTQVGAIAPGPAGNRAPEVQAHNVAMDLFREFYDKRAVLASLVKIKCNTLTVLADIFDWAGVSTGQENELLDLHEPAVAAAWIAELVDMPSSHRGSRIILLDLANWLLRADARYWSDPQAAAILIERYLPRFEVDATHMRESVHPLLGRIADRLPPSLAERCRAVAQRIKTYDGKADGWARHESSKLTFDGQRDDPKRHMARWASR
jgi:hypothetical protein